MIPHATFRGRFGLAMVGLLAWGATRAEAEHESSPDKGPRQDDCVLHGNESSTLYADCADPFPFGTAVRSRTPPRSVVPPR